MHCCKPAKRQCTKSQHHQQTHINFLVPIKHNLQFFEIYLWDSSFVPLLLVISSSRLDLDTRTILKKQTNIHEKIIFQLTNWNSKLFSSFPPHHIFVPFVWDSAIQSFVLIRRQIIERQQYFHESITSWASLFLVIEWTMCITDQTHRTKFTKQRNNQRQKTPPPTTYQ